jgi:putative proteasome-type protease
VGPPFDLLLYKKDSLEVTRYRRIGAGDRDLNSIHASWEQSLRRAVEQLPDIEFDIAENRSGNARSAIPAIGASAAVPITDRIAVRRSDSR